MVTLPADVLSALMDAADLARQSLQDHPYVWAIGIAGSMWGAVLVCGSLAVRAISAGGRRGRALMRVAWAVGIIGTCWPFCILLTAIR